MNSPSLQLVSETPGLSRYGALAAALRARIVAGEWPPASALPSEQQLAADHQVALGTLRRALELLAAQGLIERMHGRGTFVRAGLTGSPLLRFFRFGQGTGEVPVSRILARDRIAAPAAISRRLGLGAGTQVLRLRRLRLLQGQPCLLEEAWLPLPTFDALADSDPREWGDLLYPEYASRCGVHVHRAVDEVSFGTLAATQARQLALPAGHPSAVVSRHAFDLTGRCIEARTSVGDAHAFHYTVTIT